MERVAVIGAGTMGHGIAQVCAMAGYRVQLSDVSGEAVAAGIAKVRANLDKGVARGKVDASTRQGALERLAGAESLEAAVDRADLVVEAVPEKLDLKHRVFRAAEAAAPATAILGTNTSSLSIADIAAGVADPGRVIGMHFFNPVHIMKLLELVVAEGTRPAVREAAVELGQRIGKEVIVVRDVPGFATSRLGVCLGMEAIRMVEQQVASPEDIDKAMVLGYRHPIGPLRLTDLVGLDVRMHIGEYLADALDNAAFAPPALMREMVKEGRLGKKSGRGFYDWDSQEA